MSSEPLPASLERFLQCDSDREWTRALLAEVRRMVEESHVRKWPAAEQEFARQQIELAFKEQGDRILSECERRYARREATPGGFPVVVDPAVPEGQVWFVSPTTGKTQKFDVASAEEIEPPPPKEPDVCGAYTFVRSSDFPEGKGRTCELPHGHLGDHVTVLGDKERSWPKEPDVEPCRACGNKPETFDSLAGPYVKHQCPSILLKDWNERMRRSEWAPDTAARSSADDGWRSMESAPRDGSAFLVDNGKHVWIVSWSEETLHGQEAWNTGACYVTASADWLWHPLPVSLAARGVR